MEGETKRFKVVHVATVDISLRYLLLNQMRDQAACGYEVAAISTPGGDVPAIEEAGIRHLSVPMTRNFTPFADLRSLWALWRTLRRGRFDVVHTHTPKAGLLGQLAARMAGVPVVVNTLHGFYFHEHMSALERRFYIAVEKIAARCSDLILSQSREDVETAVDEGICAPEKIRHLGNGIDLERFDADRVSFGAVARARRCHGIPEGAPVVGFVGRLAARRKGFLDFLAAAREISARRPDARFLIVGDPDRGKPDAVEPSAAAAFGIASRCHFAGNRPNHELPVLYRLMNVLVLPSLFEGVPRVVMEASALGIPSVVTDVKGNREAVEAGRNGVLVPLGDVPALSRAILELINHPEAAAACGKRCREMAKERFDERVVFQKVREVYAGLLESKGRRRSAGARAATAPQP